MLLIDGKKPSEGNLPTWKEASHIYSKAYAHMRKYGADTMLIEALGDGGKEIIKTNMLRINSLKCTNEFGECNLINYAACADGCPYYR